MSSEIAGVDWNNFLEEKSAQKMYDYFIRYLSKLCDKFVPKKNSKKKNNISAPWISKELKQLIRKKKNLRYTNCAAKWGNEATKKEFNQTKKEVTTKSKQARKTFEKNLVEEAKNNPRIFFRYANSQKKVKTTIRAIKTQDGTRTTNEPAEISQIIN